MTRLPSTKDSNQIISPSSSRLGTKSASISIGKDIRTRPEFLGDDSIDRILRVLDLSLYYFIIRPSSFLSLPLFYKTQKGSPNNQPKTTTKGPFYLLYLIALFLRSTKPDSFHPIHQITIQQVLFQTLSLFSSLLPLLYPFSSNIRQQQSFFHQSTSNYITDIRQNGSNTYTRDSLILFYSIIIFPTSYQNMG